MVADDKGTPDTAPAPKKPKMRLLRFPVAGILIALSCLLVTASTLVVWSHRTVMNTDTFVGTVGPVFSHPEVDTAVAARATNELFAQLHLETRLRTALPSKVSFIAGPVVDVAENAVAEQLAKVLGSEAFQKIWQATLRNMHETLVAVLRGEDTPAVTSSGGAVVLNTVPLINRALGEVSGLVSNLTGRHIALPTISPNESSSKAVATLSSALGVHLPENYGQITLVHEDQLKPVQQMVKHFDRAAYALPILALLAAGLGLWISVTRRRSLIELTVGVALLMIVLRRVGPWGEGIAASKATNPDVARTVLDELLHGFYVLTAWVLALALVILVIALITGPYRWAVALRRWVATGARWVALRFDADHRRETLAWTRRHAEVLQMAGVVLAGILFWVLGFSWVTFLVVAVVIAVYEIVLARIKAGREPPAAAVPADAGAGKEPAGG